MKQLKAKIRLLSGKNVSDKVPNGKNSDYTKSNKNYFTLKSPTTKIILKKLYGKKIVQKLTVEYLTGKTFG